MGSPVPGVLREHFDAPLVVLAERRHQRRQLDHEPFVAAGVAHRVHRPQDRPEAVLLFHGEGIPVRGPFAEPVTGASPFGISRSKLLTIATLPSMSAAGTVCMTLPSSTPATVRGGQAEGCVLVLRPTLQIQHDSVFGDGVSAGDVNARRVQHQAAADQPGIDPNAARKAVAAMVVNQVADTDPEPRASVAFPGLHPPATNRHPKPSPIARQPMRDQVDVPVAARGLHLGRPVHNPPVLHGIRPERLPKPTPGHGSGATGRLGCPRRDHALPAALPRGPPNPLRQRNDRRQQSKQTSPGQAAHSSKTSFPSGPCGRASPQYRTGPAPSSAQVVREP